MDTGRRIIGVAGWKGSGKTTLVTRLLPVPTGRGFTVSTVKHTHDGFEVDRPGKDSHRAAGTVESAAPPQLAGAIRAAGARTSAIRRCRTRPFDRFFGA